MRRPNSLGIHESVSISGVFPALRSRAMRIAASFFDRCSSAAMRGGGTLVSIDSTRTDVFCAAFLRPST